MKNIQRYLACIIYLLLFNTLIYSQGKDEKPVFSFLVTSDIQYKNAPDAGTRHYTESLRKLKECLQTADSLKPAFVIHLGDFIDADYTSFDSVLAIWNKFPMKKYQVAGNHDFNIADKYKSSVYAKLGIDKISKGKGYYEFPAPKGWRFVVLNGDEISYQATIPGTKGREFVINYRQQLKDTSKAFKWNGALGKQQLKWLDKILTKADNKNENVIIFCHFPVYPFLISSLWNGREVIDLISRHKSTKAYFAGHVHQGSYGTLNGIRFYTFKGMVEEKSNAFSLISLFEDKIVIKGFGREQDQVLELNNNK